MTDVTGTDETINAAIAEFQSGRTAAAITRLESALDGAPDNPEIMSLLGVGYATLNDDRAEQLLKEAVALDGREPQFQLHLGQYLLSRGRVSEAEPWLRRAVERSNGRADCLAAYGECLIALGQFDRAVKILRDAVARAPGQKVFERLLSRAYFEAQQPYEARLAYERSLPNGKPQTLADALALARFALAEARYDAARSYANMADGLAPEDPNVALTQARLSMFLGDATGAASFLERGLKTDPENVGLLTVAMDLRNELSDSVVERAVGLHDRLMSQDAPFSPLAFALARHFDRKKEFDRAWTLAETANAAQAGYTFDRDKHRAHLATAAALYVEVKNNHPVSASTARPVYLTGPPRSGGSLLESVITAHPDVASIGERSALLSYTRNATNAAQIDGVGKAGEGYAQVLDRLAQADLAGLKDLGVTEKRFVDKSTMNGDYAGLMSLVHPKAQFVEFVRDARDEALSIFFHDFPAWFAYSTRWLNIAAYLETRAEMIVRWQEAGVPIGVFHYGSFVEAPQEVGPRIFHFLNLDWSEDYLAAENRINATRTFSAVQVRSEINRSGIGKWKNYETWISARVLDRLAALAEREALLAGT